MDITGVDVYSCEFERWDTVLYRIARLNRQVSGVNDEFTNL
jgi:hypothetical protein